MRARRQDGFTLVELMVSIAIMAVMGAMSWLALDVMLRTRENTQQHALATAEMQIALQQWALDLDQARLMGDTEPMGWDGKVFRLTRPSERPADGVVVVAWAVRLDGAGQMRWMRWQSAPVASVMAWKQAWETAVLWSRGGGLQGSVGLVPAQSMDVHIWSVNAWASGLSSRATSAADTAEDGAVAPAATASGPVANEATQPSGVRVMLQAPQGVLIKDWVSPLHSVPKS